MSTKAKKRWSYKSGEKGRNRVRAYEDNKSGTIMLEFYEARPGAPGSKRCRVSLGHKDRDRAKRQADEAAARLAGFGELVPGQINLQQLFDRYLAEKTPTKGRSKQNHDRLAAKLFLEAFGRSKRVHSINRLDWDRFIELRRAGEIGPSGPVRDRTVQFDLAFLRAALNWAEQSNLIERNPVRGLRFKSKDPPVRGVMTHERYEAMRGGAEEIDWRFKVALLLAHETGHRIGAIRQLEWSDIDLKNEQIHWRASKDKIGFEHTTPLTSTAVDALRIAQQAAPGIGGAWVLPAPHDPSEPCPYSRLRAWWTESEKAAGLARQPGAKWHSLRRQFATELKGVPLVDLRHLGGWKSAQTIVQCYQKPDEDTMRAALENRKVLRGA